MKKLMLAAGLVVTLCIGAMPATLSAQLTPPGTGGEGEQSNPMTAVITGPDDIAIGHTIILDASASRLVRENISYRWYVGDSKLPISRTGEALFTPDRTGRLDFRLVITSTVNGDTRETAAEHVVVVYQRKILLIADDSASDEQLQTVSDAAAKTGDYVQILKAGSSRLPLGAEDTLFSLMNRQRAAFQGAQSVVLWSESASGLEALVRTVQANQESTLDLGNQTIIVIGSRAFSSIARIARTSYDLLHPKQLFISTPDSLPLLVSTATPEQFLSAAQQQGVDVRVINGMNSGLHVWDAFPLLVNYMLTHGVDTQTVILLLMLPVIATIFAFLKQIVGITSFGLYTPSIVTLSFLALGWQTALLFLIIILLSGYATRLLMRRWRLLYIPKVAIILTVVSMTLLLLIAAGAFFRVTIAPNTVFILLIMSTLAENLLNVKLEEGWQTAMLGIGETIIGSLACVFLIRWPAFQTVILAYPELLLLTIVINIFLGKWTGLRIVEYLRFREVFRHLQEE